MISSTFLEYMFLTVGLACITILIGIKVVSSEVGIPILATIIGYGVANVKASVLTQAAIPITPAITSKLNSNGGPPAIGPTAGL